MSTNVIAAPVPAAPLPLPSGRNWFRKSRFRTPTVLQMEAVECGAAALSIILSYFGRRVPLEVLREQCGVSRDGSKASNILKAARGFGLDAKGFKKELEELGDVQLPCIIFWNFNHFLVLEGFGRRKVYLNDPATGPRTVTREEFDQAFTGVVLTFRKTAAYQPGGRPPRLLAALARRLPGSGWALGNLILATLMLVVPSLLVPVYSRVFVDQVVVAGRPNWLRPLLLAMVATALFKGVAVYLQQRTLQRLEMKLSLCASAKFFWHTLRLPMQFFSQRMAGEIGGRVGLNDRVASLLSGDLATNAVNVILVAFYAALMFRYDVTLTCTASAVAMANMLLLRWISRRRVDGNRRLSQEMGKLMGTSTAGLQIIETIKSNGSESDFFTRWAGYQAKVVCVGQSLASSSMVLGVVPSVLTAVNMALVVCVGGLRVMDGILTMGMLLAFQSLTSGFIDPVNKLVGLAGRVQEAQSDLTRLDDVLRHPQCHTFTADVAPEDAANQEATGGSALAGYLELQNITFGYSRLEPPLIQDFSLRLKPGQRTALVGGSGSGKSTVAKLICGLYQPWEGRILFDGKPREAISRDVLRQSIAAVDQDVFLFQGTTRENLTLWDGTVPEAALLQAAKDACIHADIAARAGGYDGPVDESGRNLSGGQKQRMEIARALVRNPSILVLDEATSALDPKTEQLVDDCLRRRGCTCLVIAHRLSAIRDCDEIVVMRSGRIVQRGTHDELMRDSRGHYAQLIKTH